MEKAFASSQLSVDLFLLASIFHMVGVVVNYWIVSRIIDQSYCTSIEHQCELNSVFDKLRFSLVNKYHVIVYGIITNIILAWICRVKNVMCGSKLSIFT